ncbi:MAG TPA: 3-hydroxyacyl-ACP dehydratase FabZ family protein [Candidatus Limnocylindrales bacterium]|nr:3-hydroxyacyl-ACP dehydratase FabZ family protein [Candidatus Limnocylindrales bacterium]
MRFILVDRILAVEAGRSIDVLKNVTSTEDVFLDHFPGWPIFPGALVIEVFEQSVQLLIGITSAFGHVGRLDRLVRASFRRVVRPGDQLRVRCERREAASVRRGGAGAESEWRIAATAEVDGRPVASALLQYTLAEVEPGTETARQAERVSELVRVMRQDPLALVDLG